MARRRRSAASPLAFWTDVMISDGAAAVTLSIRMPQLAAGTTTGPGSRRIRGEKLAATGEGLAVGSAAAARISARRLIRFTPHPVAQDRPEIVDAASRPSRWRVKANAKRLSKT